MRDMVLCASDVVTICLVKPQDIATHNNMSCFEIPHPINIGLVVFCIVDKHAGASSVVQFALHLVLVGIFGNYTNSAPFSQRTSIECFVVEELLMCWNCLVPSHQHVSVLRGHTGTFCPKTFTHFLRDPSCIHTRTHSAIESWESSLHSTILLRSCRSCVFECNAQDLE